MLAIEFCFQWLSSLYLSFTAAVLSLSSKYHYSGIFCKEFSGFYPPIKSVCASIVSTVHMAAIHLKIATTTDKLLVLALFLYFYIISRIWFKVLGDLLEWFPSKIFNLNKTFSRTNLDKTHIACVLPDKDKTPPSLLMVALARKVQKDPQILACKMPERSENMIFVQNGPI